MKEKALYKCPIDLCYMPRPTVTGLIGLLALHTGSVTYTPGTAFAVDVYRFLSAKR